MSVEALREALGLEVLRGHTQTGPQPRSSVVRVFVSSTCSDMSAERGVLLERAYPEVLSFCQSLGLTFEVVDLRWGVRDMVVVDHMTAELCLEEIQSCKRISAGPTFIALLGNRYGLRPIPRLISEREFELLVGKLSDLDDIKFLNKWYWRDDNTIPSSYVLQPITTHFPHYDEAVAECKELRDNDALSWQYTEARILRLLRGAALQAEKAGQMTSEQKHRYFNKEAFVSCSSVTEWEIEQGLLATQTSDSTAVLFVRDIPKLRKKEMPKTLAPFTDVTVDGLVDSEAQELLSGLKTRLFSACASCSSCSSCSACTSSLHQHCVELSKAGFEPSRKEHAQYLDSLCEQFVCQMKEKIRQQAGGASLGVSDGGGAGQGQAEGWSWLHQEICHNARVCVRECAVFCGRESLLGKVCLTMWESTNSRHALLVLFGSPGVGKTALMCKLAQEVRSLLDPQAVVVLRLLGTSLLSSDVDVLLRGVCLQICGAFGLPLPASSAANTHEELVRFFHRTLEEVSGRGEMLLLVLDSLDQLSFAHNAHKLHWLPKDLPPNVHIVVSVLDAGPPLLASLRGSVEEPGHFFEVEPLTCEQGRAVMEAYLSAAGRSLQPEQAELVLRSFQTSGSPLLLRVTLHSALQWTSYTYASDVQVGSTTQEAVDLLLLQLEKKHGGLLVARALGYIASSRDGLTESELRDVLSLDDEVLAEVYRHWLPPSTSLVRLPPLLWTRLRHDLGDLLVEGQAGGVHLLSFRHRQLRERVKERYLCGEQRVQRHGVLAEYFQGLWGDGKLKPLQLPPLHTKLGADRKVPSQPLWFAEGVANFRKLSELPYHLLHADKWDELCQVTIGSTEWLCCKTLSCGVSSVIEDLSLCTTLYECPEIQLIQDAFILIKPTLDFIDGHVDPALLYTELFARLHSFTETYPALIGHLCSQCHDWFASCPDPVLVPKSSFLPSPGGALRTTLTGFKKGKSPFPADVSECWSLRTGRQLYCVQEAVSLSVDLSSELTGSQGHEVTGSQHTALCCVVKESAVVFTQAPGQCVKAWHLETGEALYDVGPPGQAAMLGTLSGSVCVLSDGDLLTFYKASTGLEKMQMRLSSHTHTFSPTHTLSLTCALHLPRQDKLLLASGDSILFQTAPVGPQSKLLITLSHYCTKYQCPGLQALSTLNSCERVLVVLQVQAQPSLLHKQLDLPHDALVLTAAASSQAGVAISGAEDQLIRVWCLSSGKLLDTFHGLGSSVTSLAVFRQTVVSASTCSGHLKVWQLNSDPKNRAETSVPGNCALVTLSKDGQTAFFVKHGGRKEIFTWDCTSADAMDASAEVCCLELAQQKQLLFCGLRTGTVMIYPLDFPQETLCIPPLKDVPQVQFLTISPREERMAVAYDDAVCLFEITARDSFPCVEGPFERFPLTLLQSPLSCMALLPDCRLLCGGDGGEVTLYDFKSASATPLEPHGARVTCVALSHWSGQALVGSQDCVQRLWSLTPLLLDHTMEYEGFFFEGVLCAAFSVNDQYVFTGSQDKTIKVWDVASGKLLYVQYVYSPIIKMVAHKDGLVAVSQLGHFIKEGFRCPAELRPGFNPLQNLQAKFRVTSREKQLDPHHTVPKDTQVYNPTNVNFMSMFKAKPSNTCVLL
ncbi:NACHT domain- and WD repeat-containing protein 1 [Clupea harengus]|uniref:NACHT domain- and WD repeat-containing protein 1 n=1 Tax=Clupea harengus TaxID=7950 RepID=A0A8M1KRA9_CLUHA|nr:NACHT domain- and WD repeat-containing protein 1 [Clupea harengus]